MQRTCIVFLVASALMTGEALKLPQYVKPCARSDPNFNKCVEQHARETLASPILKKGDRKYKVPSLSPLLITEIKVTQTTGLNITIQDVKFQGLLGVSVDKLELDFDRHRAAAEFSFPLLEIIGKYDSKGRILLLPLNGNGDLNITLVNSKMPIESDLTVETIGETQHAVAGNATATMKPSRMYIELTNLFNGDVALGKQMNAFMNENWQDVYNSMSAPIVEAIVQAVFSIINAASSTVPFEEAFPEKL